MEILTNLDSDTVMGDLSLSLGNFDGFHLGHREIINRLIAYSKENNNKSGIVTFHPHPMELFGNREMKFITPIKNKVEMAKSFDIDYLFLVPFDESFSKLSPDDFVKSFLMKGKHKLNKIFIGFNYHFGYKARGNPQSLSHLGVTHDFSVEIIPPFKVNEKIVNSTLIKHQIQEGRIIEANNLLGRLFSISGIVVHGDGLGRTLGFPTANLEVLDEQLLPADGVYVASAKIKNQEYKGVLNIGQRPTFKGQNKRIEIHLLDFKGDIYGINLEISFIDRLRDELFFSNKELLIKQVNSDIGLVKRLKE